MSSFRRYLDRRGVALAQDSDVVNFFALPRIPDPSAHPTFEEIFQDAWLVRKRCFKNELASLQLSNESNSIGLLSLEYGHGVLTAVTVAKHRLLWKLKCRVTHRPRDEVFCEEQAHVSGCLLPYGQIQTVYLTGGAPYLQSNGGALLCTFFLNGKNGYELHSWCI